RVAPERRADGALFERRQRCRQRSAAEDQREISGLLRSERPFDHALIVDAALDDRRRLDLVVEDDRDLAADVVAGEFAELARAIRRERHADDRLAEAALLDARGLQVRTGDRNGLADGEVFGADRLSEVVFARRRK